MIQAPTVFLLLVNCILQFIKILPEFFAISQSSNVSHFKNDISSVDFMNYLRLAVVEFKEFYQFFFTRKLVAEQKF